MYKKLFTPGPTHVREKILNAQAAPMLHHRTKEYSELQRQATTKLQQLLYTKQHVYLYASSSTGMMEGSVRQASKKKILNTVNGAFSKRWHEITVANNIPCDTVEAPWGEAITPELVDEALSSGEYYQQMDKKYDKHQTPATPAVSLIQALNAQLDDILVVEGLENHWKRHEEMAAYVQNWARKYFGLFSDEKYLSLTLTNVKNTRGIDVAELNNRLALRGAAISNGYGPLKEKCFRIAHMGDLTLDDAKWITAQIEDILEL
ncbi:MAG: hypothetical protein B5M51_09115 [Anaerolinea sp. 4484_236]|nr:MAG: hypothetical protein B5M51_09115 [Anaerolinea sp. 4484_236]